MRVRVRTSHNVMLSVCAAYTMYGLVAVAERHHGHPSFRQRRASFARTLNSQE